MPDFREISHDLAGESISIHEFKRSPIYLEYQNTFLDAAVNFATRNPLFPVDVDNFKDMILLADRYYKSPRFLIGAFGSDGIRLTDPIKNIVKYNTTREIEISLGTFRVQSGGERGSKNVPLRSIVQEATELLNDPHSWGGFIHKFEVDGMSIYIPTVELIGL